MTRFPHLKPAGSFVLGLSTMLVLSGPDSTLAANDGKTSPSEFRYVAKQTVSLQPDNPFFILELPPSAYATMDPTLRDLRLFANGHELGYARIPEGNENHPLKLQEQQLKVQNRGELSNGHYSFVMVMPRSTSNDRSVRIQLNREPYLVKGTLYGSQDNRTWQRLRPITLFAVDNRASEIPLDGFDYDYLKIEFPQPTGEKLALGEAVLITTVKSNQSNASSMESVPFSTRQDTAAKETQGTVDLQTANRISSEWVLGTGEKGFYRMAALEGSHDQKTWHHILTTYLYRGVEPGDEQLSIAYPSSRYRYLRVRILNQDNEPIPIDSVKIRTHTVRVIGKAPSSANRESLEVTAYWGNNTLSAPTYDVEKVTDRNKTYPITELSLPLQNPDYQPSRPNIPISERFPWLLPAGLVAAALAVSYILYRNLKQLQK